MEENAATSWAAVRAMLENHALEPEEKWGDWSEVVAGLALVANPGTEPNDDKAAFAFLQKSLDRAGFFDDGLLDLHAIVVDPLTPWILRRAIAEEPRAMRLHVVLAAQERTRADADIRSALLRSPSPHALKRLCRHLRGADLSEAFRRLVQISPATATDLLDTIGAHLAPEDAAPLLQCPASDIRLRTIAALPGIGALRERTSAEDPGRSTAVAPQDPGAGKRSEGDRQAPFAGSPASKRPRRP